MMLLALFNVANAVTVLLVSHNQTSGGGTVSTLITDGMPATYVLGQPDFTTATAATTSTGMNSPEGVAYDPTEDRLLVADSANTRLLVFDLADGVANGEAASAVYGQPDMTTATAYLGGSRTALTMDWPAGIHVAPETGRVLLVEESDDRVVVNFPAN